MSKFLSSRCRSLVPYTPGEQPSEMKYIKLNTNESPFPPSERAVQIAARAAESLHLYPDPTARELTEKIAETCGVKPSQVLATNGSDEILSFAFQAFCDEDTPAVFPDITYGFYSVFADLYGVPYQTIPLREDFTVKVEDYIGIGKTIFLANPNAPTGLALSLADIETILQSNPDNIVVIDEAYVDFGAESAVGLIDRYDNLLVTQTFSKSRSMAGARLGFGVANEKIIADLNTIKYSTNPYNINRMTMAAGIGVLEDAAYTEKNIASIVSVREATVRELEKLSFTVIPSHTNFVFAKHATLGGKEIYQKLKQKGILVRHFTGKRICDYNRITIGSQSQMEILIRNLKEILEEQQ